MKREVSEDLRFQLWRHAKSRGQSLQHRLLEELTALAKIPFPDEAPGGIDTRSLEEALALLPKKRLRETPSADRNRASFKDFKLLHTGSRHPGTVPSRSVERWTHSKPPDFHHAAQNQETGHGFQVLTAGRMAVGVTPEI